MKIPEVPPSATLASQRTNRKVETTFFWQKWLIYKFRAHRFYGFELINSKTIQYYHST
jgi:hypothetical protein